MDQQTPNCRSYDEPTASLGVLDRVVLGKDREDERRCGWEILGHMPSGMDSPALVRKGRMRMLPLWKGCLA